MDLARRSFATAGASGDGTDEGCDTASSERPGSAARELFMANAEATATTRPSRQGTRRGAAVRRSSRWPCCSEILFTGARVGTGMGERRGEDGSGLSVSEPRAFEFNGRASESPNDRTGRSARQQNCQPLVTCDAAGSPLALDPWMNRSTATPTRRPRFPPGPPKAVSALGPRASGVRKRLRLHRRRHLLQPGWDHRFPLPLPRRCRSRHRHQQHRLPRSLLARQSRDTGRAFRRARRAGEFRDGSGRLPS